MPCFNLKILKLLLLAFPSSSKVNRPPPVLAIFRIKTLEKYEAIEQRKGMMVVEADQQVDRSPASSCISSDDEDNQLKYSNKSPKSRKPMVLVGCQRCLMYVMLAHDESKCPKCEGSVLLEFSSQGGFRLTNRRTNRSSR